VQFGVDVRRIVEGETKVSKLPKMVRSELARSAEAGELIKKPSSKQDEQAENLRSMFVAMAEDWRIVVVRLVETGLDLT
jgi:GTP pyrophosphokinase